MSMFVLILSEAVRVVGLFWTDQALGSSFAPLPSVTLVSGNSAGRVPEALARGPSPVFWGPLSTFDSFFCNDPRCLRPCVT